MNTQPEALRLADELDKAINQIDAEDNVVHVARWFVEDAAGELHRLHALNAELLKELRYITSISNGQVSRVARAAIARAEGTYKAEGEQA